MKRKLNSSQAFLDPKRLGELFRNTPPKPYQQSLLHTCSNLIGFTSFSNQGSKSQFRRDFDGLSVCDIQQCLVLSLPAQLTFYRLRRNFPKPPVKTPLRAQGCRGSRCVWSHNGAEDEFMSVPFISQVRSQDLHFIKDLHTYSGSM